MQDVCVDYNSCLSVTLFDTFGDGICCQYGEGNFLLINSFGDTLLTHDGEFIDNAEELFCPNGEGCSFTTLTTTTLASSESIADGSITIIPIGGFSPYEFSIDGGLTYVSENSFTNLPADDYKVVVRDASKTCIQEETVTVEIDILESTVDNYLSNIKLYPNPTRDILIVEINESVNTPGNMNIEIYDVLGKLMHRKTLMSNSQKSEISLMEYTSGNYIIKCYNQNFEKHFKVIKI